MRTFARASFSGAPSVTAPSTSSARISRWLSGFFVYSPQALVGVMAANLATKLAAATAVGLTSIFAYASTVLSGWRISWLVEHHGWAPAFTCLIFVAVIGAGLFALALPAKANGYGYGKQTD